MDRLILTLLKLLFQLAVFLLTGRWPRIEGRRKPAGRMRPAPAPARPHKGARPAPRGGLADVRAPARGSSIFVRAPKEASSRPVSRASEMKGRTAAGTRAPARDRLSPELGRRSLASVVRDPRAIRDALVLGAALGARRPRR